MANIANLTSTVHRQLRIITERGAEYGDAIMSAATFPAEFRNLQSTYPIVFTPSEDGASFDSIALFGFERGDNLYLGPDGWDAAVLPLSVERIPFLIGGSNGGLSVHVDLDHPHCSVERGELLFLTYGGPSEYMERMTSVLRTLQEGLETGRAFTATLQELGLLESFVMDIELDDGAEHPLAGFYTINEERLRALPGDALARLSQAGYLQPIHMAIASLSQFRGLIARHNRKLATGL